MTLCKHRLVGPIAVTAVKNILNSRREKGVCCLLIRSTLLPLISDTLHSNWIELDMFRDPLPMGKVRWGTCLTLNPPTSRAQNPCWPLGLLSGARAQGSLLRPPTSREPTLVRGVALVHGGLRPIDQQRPTLLATDQRSLHPYLIL